MNSFARYMGMEDRVGERRFVNEVIVTSSEAHALSAAFDANKVGLRGEKVLFATVLDDGCIKLITRTRTQRFLAWITRSF